MLHSDLLGMRYGKIITNINPQKTLYLNGINIQQPFRAVRQQKVIMLLHGFSSTPAVFRHLLPFLHDYDTIFAPVLAGHSSSINNFAKATSTDWLISAQSAYQALFESEHYAHIHLLGLSLGGLLAQKLSQIEPPHQLILLAPAFDLVLPINALIIAAKALQHFGGNSIRNRAGNIKAYDQYEIAYRRLPITTILEILHFIKLQNIKPMNCPTSLFLGDHDTIIANKKVAARYTTHHSTKIFWLKNSAHVLPLDNDRDLLGRHIANIGNSY